MYCIKKNKNYQSKNSRKRKKSVFYDEIREGQVDILAKDNFRINTFYVVINSLATALNNRRKAYETFCIPFDFLTKIYEFKDSKILV